MFFSPRPPRRRTPDGRAQDFRHNELAIKLNDRLLAPNTAQTYEAVSGDRGRLGAQLWRGATVDIEHIPSELTLFEVRLRSDQSPYLPTLLNQLTAPSR